MPYTLDIDGTTQWATLYVDGRPVATLARRRVYDKGPAWIAYDLHGTEVRRFWIGGTADLLAKLTLKALARAKARAEGASDV